MKKEVKNIKIQIDDYVQFGQEPSGFVFAVLCNDLLNAYTRADCTSIENMTDIIMYVFYEVPRSMWGTAEKVRNHIKQN